MKVLELQEPTNVREVVNVKKKYVDLICRLLQNDVNDAIVRCGKSHNKKWHVF